MVLLGLLLWACKGKEKKNSTGSSSATESATPAGFSVQFAGAGVPYQLTDTALLNNKDTARLSADYLTSLLSDSTVHAVFGKTKGIHYSPLCKLSSPGKEVYYLVKGAAGSKKAAFLLVFTKNGDYGGATPFLVPDEDPTTVQSSALDKSFTVTRLITQKNSSGVLREGKDVLAYDGGARRFSLIMTDLLNDEPEVLVNPIDTFARTNKLAGDYYANKKNLIAVRDGRHPSQILVYIHTENKAGDCKGELKGEFILTSSKTAVYRQGGDPCILALTFSGNTVAMNEERGCGNYRGLDCPLQGTFTRKKEEKPKESTKRHQRPKPAK